MIIVPPGGGEVVGDAPDRRVEILSDHDSLHATWSRFGPYRDGADLHVHRHHADLFYVLQGELTVRLGPEGREVPVTAGTLVRVPPLVVHGFRNATGAELRYLNFHAPGTGFADYMRGRNPGFDQHDPPADGGRSPDEVAFGPADVPDIAVFERDEPLPPADDGRLTSLYVLEGELLAGDHRAPAGTWLQAPDALAASGVVRYLEIRTPPA